MCVCPCVCPCVCVLLLLLLLQVGLIKSLQSLVWLADVASNDVIPRGYDLSIPQVHALSSPYLGPI